MEKNYDQVEVPQEEVEGLNSFFDLEKEETTETVKSQDLKKYGMLSGDLATCQRVKCVVSGLTNSDSCHKHGDSLNSSGSMIHRHTVVPSISVDSSSISSRSLI